MGPTSKFNYCQFPAICYHKFDSSMFYSMLLSCDLPLYTVSEMSMLFPCEHKPSELLDQTVL